MSIFRSLSAWLRAEDIPGGKHAAAGHPWMMLGIAPAVVGILALAVTGFVVVAWPRGEHVKPPAPVQYFQPGYGPVGSSSAPSSTTPPSVVASSSPVVQDASSTTTEHSDASTTSASQAASSATQGSATTTTPAQTRTQSDTTSSPPSSATSSSAGTRSSASANSIANTSSGTGTSTSTSTSSTLQQIEAMCPPGTTTSGPNAYSSCASNGSIVCQSTSVPAPLFGSYGEWSCSTEVYSPNRIYTTTASCVGATLAATCRTTAIDHATQLLADNGCPGPISGTIGPSWTGNRINLTLRIPGPSGSPTVDVILDTGGVDTQLPNSVMVAAGFKSSGSITMPWPLVQRGTLTEYIYHVPYPEVLDNGTWVPLGYGTATIYGVINMPASVGPLMGPDMLKAGTSLTTSGANWTLTPPCA